MRSEIWKYVSAILAPKILAIYQLFDRIDQELEKIENAKQELDAKFQTLKQEFIDKFNTLQQTVTTTLNNFQTTIQNKISELETTLFSSIDQDTVENGLITAPTIQPDASNHDFIQRYTIDRTSITIDMPTLPPNGSAVNSIVLFIDTCQPSCLVSLGTGLSFVHSGGGGPILLEKQLYQYEIIILSSDEAYVKTTLVKEAPVP